jgi:Beta-lactamase superfamily domain
MAFDYTLDFAKIDFRRTLAAIGAVAPVVAADIICARRLTRQATEEAARPRNKTLRLPATAAGSPDFEHGSIFFVGTATVILRYAGFTILTDPNFLHQGDHAHLGYGLTSERLTEPALDIDELPPVDFVVLSHYHGDHFDQIVERRLDKRLPIITTHHAAAKLRAKGFREARGMETWETFTVEKGDARLRITSIFVLFAATRRHQQPLSRDLALSLVSAAQRRAAFAAQQDHGPYLGRRNTDAVLFDDRGLVSAVVPHRR